MSRKHDSAPDPVAVRGCLDDELDWFFGYAERALRRGRVALLPSHAAARVRARDASRKAARLAQRVDRCLGALAAPHAVILRAVFTPRRWPKAVESAFERLAPVAVRLFGVTEPWPGRTSHLGLEEATALELAARLGGGEARHESLCAQAQQLFQAAMSAYAAQRREVLPGSR